ncbi:hypothetical protein ELH21_10180 [Rhizobium leguminosarum]|uniref:hypothetical protein n=1 Tax=Rhizobium leguminosarum TaxID=384 RepID=UPI00102F834D|nr:hypothetical protein [Rhizobium leguminosarum]TBD04740.1 hypothetical protein ELH21_10180 [Rhizobium leguminosarum]
MTIYENVVIGSFLYLLGLENGRQLKSTGSVSQAVNLLQQTPLDQSLADVLLQTEGSLYILEFKRVGASQTKERKKLENVLLCLKDRADLVDVSRRIHWYIRSKLKNGQLMAYVSPYLDFGSKATEMPIEDLCTKFVADGKGNSVAMDRCLEYVYRMQAALAVDGSSSGTIIIVAKNGSNIRHVVIEDLTDLSKIHSKLVELRSVAVVDVPTVQDDPTSADLTDERTSAHRRKLGS